MFKTAAGNYEITDNLNPDRKLILRPAHSAIILTAAEHDTDNRAAIILGTRQLDELAAIILELRETQGI
jgi:hypothetical protein